VADQDGRIHSQVAELLSAYIDDEVSVDERALVEEHLATCTACAQDLTTLRQTVALLGELPQVAAPRPFTLRESDVRPVRDTARLVWLRLPWAQRLVGAAAVLLCVVVVGGVVLLGRGGMVGAPAAPGQIAMEARPAADDVASEAIVGETVVGEAETVLEVEKEDGQAIEPAAPPPAPAAEEATAEEFGVAQEAPAEEAPMQQKAAADEGEALLATQPARAASGAVPTLSATPAPIPTATPAPIPTTTPAPAAESLPAVQPTPTLLEVEELNLEIEPGVIRARGRVPLPEGLKLLAVLWRNGQPIEWATIESQRLVVEADGQFSLVLVARAEAPDLDLFAAEPAYYEIRIRPVDPPAPVEIRIPFDTYGPPLPAPTSTS
jgi:anti-sigma factor RsiW